MVGGGDDGFPLFLAGTVWTASAHIITAVIGSGVLSLAWAIARLGWVGGILALTVFSAITLYTSTLLADCYRCPETGKRSYTYMDAVRNNLGKISDGRPIFWHFRARNMIPAVIFSRWKNVINLFNISARKLRSISVT